MTSEETGSGAGKARVPAEARSLTNDEGDAEGANCVVPAGGLVPLVVLLRDHRLDLLVIHALGLEVRHHAGKLGLRLLIDESLRDVHVDQVDDGVLERLVNVLPGGDQALLLPRQLLPSAACGRHLGDAFSDPLLERGDRVAVGDLLGELVVQGRVHHVLEPLDRHVEDRLHASQLRHLLQLSLTRRVLSVSRTL
eukprot:767904-Hanusia_phi.AAC.4